MEATEAEMEVFSLLFAIFYLLSRSQATLGNEHEEIDKNNEVFLLKIIQKIILTNIVCFDQPMGASSIHDVFLRNRLYLGHIVVM